MKATHTIKCLTWRRWTIKCLVAVAGDSARLVSSVHVQEEVLGVMGLEVQSEQQEDQCPLWCHCVTTNTALLNMNLDPMAINNSINHSMGAI